MKVWVLHYDVEYEFGHVLSVHETEGGAVAAARKAMKEDNAPFWSDAYHETGADGIGGSWGWGTVSWSVYQCEVEP